ncbi:MAG: zf-HC2 domain-containing protein [Acidobacteriia bacterium]|nr:zf-HC2 domain-containing protein [Terriglobia bacterium]
MVVNCEEVWREVSNYLDGEVDPTLRAAIEEHVRGCKNCTAVVDGTRNVLQLYGDERLLEVPFGFSQRLHRRLDQNGPGNRRTFLGWMVAAAAACLIVGTIEVASAFRTSELRSEHAQPGNRIPPEMMVVVSENGKLFHRAGCEFIHEKNKLRTITAAEASREGYSPCVRCLKKYLAATASAQFLEDPATAPALSASRSTMALNFRSTSSGRDGFR